MSHQPAGTNLTIKCFPTSFTGLTQQHTTHAKGFTQCFTPGSDSRWHMSDSPFYDLAHFLVIPFLADVLLLLASRKQRNPFIVLMRNWTQVKAKALLPCTIQVNTGLLLASAHAPPNAPCSFRLVFVSMLTLAESSTIRGAIRQRAIPGPCSAHIISVRAEPSISNSRRLNDWMIPQQKLTGYNGSHSLCSCST